MVISKIQLLLNRQNISIKFPSVSINCKCKDFNNQSNIIIETFFDGNTHISACPKCGGPQMLRVLNKPINFIVSCRSLLHPDNRRLLYSITRKHFIKSIIQFHAVLKHFRIISRDIVSQTLKVGDAGDINQ